jgi:hypothetical protein
MSTANKIQLVSNRIELAKDLLLQQFKNKPNINALLEVLVNRLQELENNLNDIQQVRTLENAYGRWLDDIGEEAGVSRGDYMDNDYKTAIKIAYARRSSSASVDDILRIVMLLTNDDEVTIINPYPYYLELCGFLWCVKDSTDGLRSIAKLFPINTGIRIITTGTNPFTLDKEGSGIGQGTISSLVYYDYGDSSDPRFTTSETAILPPVVNVPVKNVLPPSVSGNNTLGSVLSVNKGSWDGDEPITYTYQWLREGGDILGATSTTYTIVSGDLSKNISVRVTAANAYGSQSASSNSVYISGVVPPVFTVVDGLGFGADSLYSSVPVLNTAISTEVKITFQTDGNTRVDTLNNGATILPYISGGVSSDYTVTYTVLSGPELSGLNQNQAYTLSSELIVKQRVTSDRPTIKTGVYTFTIRKISNPTDFKTRTVTITAEIEQ